MGHLPFGNDLQYCRVHYYQLRAKRVRALIRKEFHDSFTEFADRVGVADSTVSRWFMEGAGRKNIGEKNARKIETILGLGDHALDRPEKEPVHLRLTNDASTHWPFEESVSFIDFNELEPAQKQDIGELIEDRVARFKAKNGRRRRKKNIED